MSQIVIDAENYVILVRTNSHPAERRTVFRDDAVGLDAARIIRRRLMAKHPQCLVEIYHCPHRGAMIAVE